MKLTSVAARIEEIEVQIANSELLLFDFDQGINRLRSEVNSAEASKDAMAQLIDMLADPVHSPAPFEHYTEDQIYRRSRLSVIIANLVKEIRVFSVGTRLQMDGWKKPDSTPSFDVKLRSGHTRFVGPKNSFKLDLRKKGGVQSGK